MIICYSCHEKERKGCDDKGDWSLEKVRKFLAERDARTAVQQQEVEGDCLVCHKETAKYDRYTSVMFGYPAVTHGACKFRFTGYICWHLAVKKVEDIMTDVLDKTIVADFARVKQKDHKKPAFEVAHADRRETGDNIICAACERGDIGYEARTVHSRVRQTGSGGCFLLQFGVRLGGVVHHSRYRELIKSIM